MTDNTEKIPQVNNNISGSYEAGIISKDIIISLKKGDYKAYDIVYMAYKGVIKKFLLKITGSDQDTEEMLQEIFVNVWIKRAHINTDKDFKVYLYSIVKNSLLNKRKSIIGNTDNAATESNSNFIPDESLLNNMVVASEIRLIIDIAANNMPELRRKVYEMRIEGLSYDRIASELNITLNSTRQHFSRALGDIKKLIMLIISYMD